MRSQIMGALRKAGDAIGAVDDKVQGSIRYALGERDGLMSVNNRLDLAKALYADVMHGSRHEVDDTWQGKAYLAGTRAMQAGGLTLAGKGLYDLAAQFGNAADYPEDGQLRL